MNKQKLLIISVSVLFLLNCGTIGFLFLSKKNKPESKRMPKEIVIEKLHFDKSQIAEYDKVILLHQQKIRSLDDSIRISKNKLYQLLNENSNVDSGKDNLIMTLANYQKQIELTHFNHFMEIKAICRKDQLADFENLTEELSKIFSHPKKRPHN
jgi:hypothetical protein